MFPGVLKRQNVFDTESRELGILEPLAKSLRLVSQDLAWDYEVARGRTRRVQHNENVDVNGFNPRVCNRKHIHLARCFDLDGNRSACSRVVREDINSLCAAESDRRQDVTLQELRSYIEFACEAGNLAVDSGLLGLGSRHCAV